MSWLPTSKRQKEIEVEVDRMLQRIGLNYPIHNLLDIAQAQGLDIYLSDFHEFDGDVSGVIKYPDGAKPSIYLNRNYSKVRQTFTLAHELGHYLLHKGKTKYRVDRYNSINPKEVGEETEAHFFAATLLVPLNKFQKLLNQTDDLGAIALFFGVSEATIRNRQRWLETL